jgi:hypothetical protein
MKTRSTMAGIAALALFAAGVAQAQTPGNAPQPPPMTQSKINLTLEQRHTIKEIIKDAKVDEAPANTAIGVGATVPGSVHLNPMPAAVAEKVPQIKSHMYFMKEGKVVIVDPKDKTVVDAIE